MKHQWFPRAIALAACAGTLLVAGCGGGGAAPEAGAAGTVLKSSAAPLWTGTWWNAAESGTGFIFEHQGNVGVATFFVYDDAGRAVWYSAPGTFTQNADGSASFAGTLQRFSGGQPAHSSTYRVPSPTPVGAVSIAFAASGAATVQLPGRTLQATRFVFGAGGPPPNRPEAGIYWNPAENGRGYVIDMQGNTAALTMFHYAEDGSPTWHIATGDLSSGAATVDFNAFSNGQTLNGPYKPASAPVAQGRFTMRFTSACRGTVHLEGMPPVEIVRFAFGGLPAGAECRTPSAPAGGSINATTSYVHQNMQEDMEIGLIVHPAPGPAHYYDARVFSDLDGDGVKELVVAPGQDVTTPIAARVYRLSDGRYVEDTARYFDGSVPGQIHARKLLTADFNGDGRLDLYFIDHGWDHEPFPGAPNVLAVSGANGKLAIKPIPNNRSQFHHCGAAGDIDNNGTVDVFACGAAWQARDGSKSGYFLRNDGQANMTVTTGGVPESILQYSNASTAELVDVDGDNFLDLLVGDRGWNPSLMRDEFRSIVFWGDGSGSYSDARSTRLPLSAQFPVVYDFKAEDIDGDGVREVIALSVSQSLQGYYIHILKRTGPRQYADESLVRIVKNASSWEGNTAPWFPWLRMSDINGDGKIDIGIGDSSAFRTKRNIRWFNDGSGNFVRQ